MGNRMDGVFTLAVLFIREDHYPLSLPVRPSVDCFDFCYFKYIECPVSQSVLCI